jgi:hypothetical protein
LRKAVGASVPLIAQSLYPEEFFAQARGDELTQIERQALGAANLQRVLHG